MKERLFKGKRKDTGEWTEGYFFKIWDRVFLLWGMTGDSPNMEEVIPETVEQFVGLVDKNGKKIFEGDVLRGFAYPFRDGDGEHNYYAEVVWFENSPAFGFITHKNPKSNVRGISEGNCEYMEDWEAFLWEVIGNVYDDKELLGEQGVGV